MFFSILVCHGLIVNMALHKLSSLIKNKSSWCDFTLYIHVKTVLISASIQIQHHAVLSKLFSVLQFLCIFEITIFALLLLYDLVHAVEALYGLVNSIWKYFLKYECCQ